MYTRNSRWRRLLIFCLGVSGASFFIMEWLATDFWIDDSRFTILGLELFYSRSDVVRVLSGILPAARAALTYHLTFDFVFMVGIYPAIASFCMVVRDKTAKKTAQSLLFALAVLQPLAWIFDIVENRFLLGWLKDSKIGEEFEVYHNIVLAKWIIALAGIITAIVVWLTTTSNGVRKQGIKIK